ncbi:MAG: hypothetical protein RSD49_06775 [Hafnia sp.]
MLRLDRFSKKAFIAFCEEKYAKCSARYGVDALTLSDIENRDMLERLEIGRAVTYKQVADEVKSGLGHAANGRFTRPSLSGYLTERVWTLAEKQGFKSGNGYSQVEGKSLVVIQDYVVFDSLNGLFEDLQHG